MRFHTQVKGVWVLWKFLAHRHLSSFFPITTWLNIYLLARHHYTWFRGRSMSKIDWAFASSSCILQYPSLSLTKYPRGLEFILKFDFHKAFDLFLWDYVDEVMNYMNFGSKWRSLIQECISGSKLAILINGSPRQEFGIERGLRQGDLHHPPFCLT